MITYPTKTISNPGAQVDKAIELKDAGKKYPHSFKEFWALQKVSFDISRGEILGIIGRNGAGKTTLLNIIAGVLSPSEGKVIPAGRVRGLFNLGVGFQDELTGRENIFLNGALLGAEKKELEEKLESMIEFSELGDFINMPLGTYSQGMRLRLGFSIIANLDFDILAIDEVLAVGDSLFQSKCFEKLMDFKRRGKTLILTTQSMELIERLCDKVALLDHGRLLFHGDTAEGINKYRALLSSERFFVGPKRNDVLIENTKKWADDISSWGKKLGTKEVIIESVEFIKRFGWRCNRIKSREPLKIKVNFRAKNRVKDVHFGVAVFREDGVYCYGPNTEFDGYKIPELNPGRGWFELNYKELFLAPGEYYFSVAIWDKEEILAFDYHDGYYKLTVTGYKNEKGELLNLPFKLKYGSFNAGNSDPELSLKLLNSQGEEKDVFITNEPVRVALNFSGPGIQNKDPYARLGIFRDDGVYCQEIVTPIGKSKELNILFPKLALLPGGYKIRAGETACPFRMVFNQKDQGTVYLEHHWEWGRE